MSIFVFDDNEKLHEIKIADVTCIRKLDKNRRIMFRTRDGCFYAPSTIVQLQEAYWSFGFVQIDKNKLINLNQVDNIKGNELHVGDHVYDVARRRLDEIQEMLNRINK